MNTITKTLAVACLAASCFGAARAQEEAAPSMSPRELTVMSYNIRYGTAPDGESAWDLRKEALTEVIRTRMPDLLGTQEGLDFQLEYLAERMPEYERFGIGRDEGGKGEFAAVFYRKDRFRRTDGGTFWLSETPDRTGALSWNTSHNRIATWVRLEEIETGRELLLLNTHLDHQSEEARVKGTELIVERLQGELAAPAMIVVGDFNAVGEASVPWTLLTGTGLRDAWLAAEERVGPSGTVPGFVPGARESVARIDWILVSQGFEVLHYETVDTVHNGRYPSDHLAVFATLLF